MSNLPALFVIACAAYVAMSETTGKVDKKKNIVDDARNASDPHLSETGKSIPLEHIPVLKMNDTLPNDNNPSKITIVAEGSSATPEDLTPPQIWITKNETSEKEVPKSKIESPKGNLTVPGTTAKPALSKNKTIPVNLNKTEIVTKLNVSREHKDLKNVTGAKIFVAKPRKLKPIKTVSEPEEDEPLPPISKSYKLRMPEKMDYIVPLIVTTACLPVLIVAMYVLYNRGRDYWDKRHYRRMDFLIDGMYNE